jgi:prepilin-type processing-associated H-X9-DG protein
LPEPTISLSQFYLSHPKGEHPKQSLPLAAKDERQGRRSFPPSSATWPKSAPNFKNLNSLKPAGGGMGMTCQWQYAHFYQGSLSSINLGFADGHVELQIAKQIIWQFSGNGLQKSCFY